MRRAWQLASLNHPVHKAKRRERIGAFMAMAWKEAREGRTETWTFLSAEHEARAIERQLTTLQFDDRRTQAHYALMDSLRASIRALSFDAEERRTMRAAAGGRLPPTATTCQRNANPEAIAMTGTFLSMTPAAAVA